MPFFLHLVWLKKNFASRPRAQEYSEAPNRQSHTAPASQVTHTEAACNGAKLQVPVRQRERERGVVVQYTAFYAGIEEGILMAGRWPLLFSRMKKKKITFARSVDGHLPPLGRPTRILCFFTILVLLLLL